MVFYFASRENIPNFRVLVLSILSFLIFALAMSLLFAISPLPLDSESSILSAVNFFLFIVAFRYLGFFPILLGISFIFLFFGVKFRVKSRIFFGMGVGFFSTFFWYLLMAKDIFRLEDFILLVSGSVAGAFSAWIDFYLFERDKS